MEKNENELKNIRKSHIDTSYDHWFPDIELDFSWAALLEAFFTGLAKKMRLSPQPVKKASSQPKWW